MKPSDEVLRAIGLATTRFLADILAEDGESFDAVATEIMFRLPKEARDEAVVALMVLPTPKPPLLRLIAGQDVEPC